MKKFLFFLTLVLLIVSCSKPALHELDQYKQLLTMDDPADRADGLESFIAKYPVGEKTAAARLKLVEARMESKDEARTIVAARLYLDSLSGSRRVSATVNVINQMADRGMAPDTVMAWARAIEPVADTTHRFYWARARNAQATVLRQRGNLEPALELQRSAVARYADEPEFIRNLAVLEQETGKSLEAAARVTPLAIDGDGQALAYFLAWTESLTTDKTRNKHLRDSLIQNKTRFYIDSTHAENKTMARSVVAVFLARCGVQNPETDAWSLKPLSDASVTAADGVAYRQNRVLYLAALGKNEEALDVFGPIAEVVDPWEANNVVIYGRLLESSNRHRDALDLYATAMLVEEADNIKTSYIAAYEKVIGTRKGMRSFLELWRDSLENFQPAHRESNRTSSKVVLAELFTGAECGPCLSADLAFDALSEYYGRDEVAILEYHLHIPRPDPMTNNDGWNRYQYYGGSFGTPTTIVDGVDRTFGGGPKFLKRNRFFFFDQMINRHINEKPAIDLAVESTIKGDVIDATVKVNSKSVQNLAVQMALVEKMASYKGGNGVTDHRFVVRAVSDSGKAIPTRLGSASILRSFDLTGIEKHVNDQMDQPHEQRSWGNRRKVKPEWKNPPPKFNRDNLALVVWLQDPITKKVVQSVYHEFAWLTRRI